MKAGWGRGGGGGGGEGKKRKKKEKKRNSKTNIKWTGSEEACSHLKAKQQQQKQQRIGNGEIACSHHHMDSYMSMSVLAAVFLGNAFFVLSTVDM